MNPSVTEQYEVLQEFNEYANQRIVLLDTADVRPFCKLNENGSVVYSMHLGQRRVMESKKRIIAAVAGRQGGKSAVGAPWLWEEMRRKGPGLYMVVAPSYPLLIDSAIPKIKELFEYYYRYGKVRTNPPSFEFTKEGEKRLFKGTKWANSLEAIPTTIRFGHAANPESLEAKTAKAAWLDEAGQDGFKLASWEAIRGRVTTTGGRILITTTPYNLGWLKTRIFDPWEKAGEDHKEIDVITWASTENPKFTEEEYLGLKGTMPLWKWNMFYNGMFGMPSGLIYGVAVEFEDVIKMPAASMPTEGARYGGLDFGAQNTCAVMAIKDGKTGNIYVYRSYKPGYQRAYKEHVADIKMGVNYDRFVGGAPGESDQRGEFTQNGLYVDEPSISDVQSGIDRVYGLMQQQKLFIAAELSELWDELYTYQYETDPDTGNVLPELKIKNKSRYHHMDALRYLCSLFGAVSGGNIAHGGGERPAIAAARTRGAQVVGIRQVGFGNVEMPPNFNRVARSNGNPNSIRARRR